MLHAKKWLVEPNAHRPLLKKVWWITLLAGFGCKLPYIMFNEQYALEMLHTTVGAPLVAIFYATSIVLLTTNERGKKTAKTANLRWATSAHELFASIDRLHDLILWLWFCLVWKTRLFYRDAYRYCLLSNPALCQSMVAQAFSNRSIRMAMARRYLFTMVEAEKVTFYCRRSVRRNRGPENPVSGRGSIREGRDPSFHY